MIYLNIQTEQRTKDFISDTITIPVDDIRVAPFFQAVPAKANGIGYKRNKDIDGLPIFKEYQLDENNEFYSHYLEDGTPDLVKELKELKKIAKQDINSACAKAITSGFTSSALGTQHTYQSEQIDQLNLIGVVTAGQDDYFKCGVEDADGNVTWNYEKHTIAQLQQVLQDGKVHKQGLLQKANTLKTQVANATTVKDVEAIVW